MRTAQSSSGSGVEQAGPVGDLDAGRRPRRPSGTSAVTNGHQHLAAVGVRIDEQVLGGAVHDAR